MRGVKMKMPNEGDRIHEVIYLREIERGCYNRRFGRFVCVCGKEFDCHIYEIVKGKTKGCGCKNGTWNRIFTDDQVIEIKNNIWKEGLTLKEVAEKYGVSIGTIFNIKIERTYKHVA